MTTHVKSQNAVVVPFVARATSPRSVLWRLGMLCQGLMVGALVVVAGQAQAFEKLIEVDTAGCSTNVAINNAIGQSFKLSASTALDSVDI